MAFSKTGMSWVYCPAYRQRLKRSRMDAAYIKSNQRCTEAKRDKEVAKEMQNGVKERRGDNMQEREVPKRVATKGVAKKVMGMRGYVVECSVCFHLWTSNWISTNPFTCPMCSEQSHTIHPESGILFPDILNTYRIINF